MTKADFKKMYYENTNKEMAKKLGISLVTLNTHLNKSGIIKKGYGYRKEIKLIIID